MSISTIHGPAKTLLPADWSKLNPAGATAMELVLVHSLEQGRAKICEASQRGTFISRGQYIDFLPSGTPIAGSTCSICQESFTLGSVGVIQTIQCYHVFHRPCLVYWLHSTNDSRNSCPECRTKLCKPGLLTPRQAVEIRVEGAPEGYWQAFGTAKLTNLFMRTDELFYDFRRDQSPLWQLIVQIGNEYETENQEQLYMCPEHERHGRPWLFYMIGYRMMELLHDADDNRSSPESMALIDVLSSIEHNITFAESPSDTDHTRAEDGDESSEEFPFSRERNTRFLLRMLGMRLRINTSRAYRGSIARLSGLSPARAFRIANRSE